MDYFHKMTKKEIEKKYRTAVKMGALLMILSLLLAAALTLTVLALGAIALNI